MVWLHFEKRFVRLKQLYTVYGYLIARNIHSHGTFHALQPCRCFCITLLSLTCKRRTAAVQNNY